MILKKVFLSSVFIFMPLFSYAHIESCLEEREYADRYTHQKKTRGGNLWVYEAILANECKVCMWSRGSFHWMHIHLSHGPEDYYEVSKEDFILLADPRNRNTTRAYELCGLL